MKDTFVGVEEAVVARLYKCSPASWQLWIAARVHNSGELNDGHMEERDLLIIASEAAIGVAELQVAARDLVTQGAWTKESRGWFDPHHCDHNDSNTQRMERRKRWRRQKSNSDLVRGGTSPTSTGGTSPTSGVENGGVPLASVPVRSSPIQSVPDRDPDDPPPDPDDLPFDAGRNGLHKQSGVRTAAGHRDDYRTDVHDRLPADAEPELAADVARRLMAGHRARQEASG